MHGIHSISSSSLSGTVDLSSIDWLFYSRLVSTILARMNIQGFDVKALRAFRVLRPLRLVSGVPSEWCISLIVVDLFDNDAKRDEKEVIDVILCRFTSCSQCNSSCNDSSLPHCSSRLIRHCHLCHYRIGIVLWKTAFNLVSSIIHRALLP